MKRLFGLTLAGLLFLGVFSTPAVAGRDIVKVMTRNQYLGADLEPLFQALTDPEGDPNAAALDVLEQIAANVFPLRALRLAMEVALTKPHLIGLQEVFDFKLDGVNGIPPFVDHLTETLNALAAKGQSYDVAATVKNLDITIPIDIDGDEVPELVSVVGRDVILAQEGVEFTSLTGDYMAGGLCGVPLSLPGLPFLQSTQSEDGCNYTIVVEVPTLPPPDTITIERGFVGVDATVGGKTYRFVSTHLEGVQPDPVIQSLQSVELVGTLLATNLLDLPLILLGDFNSSPEDMPIGLIDTPYQIIVDAGFADVWERNLLKFFDRNGFTCCQDKDLLNKRSLLDERIDIIFVRYTSFLPLAFVTGRVPIFPLRQPPNWASDHGGVFGKLIFRRGARD